MPWNSTYPVGNISVKDNRTVGQQNTTYTEVTMGNSIVGTNTASTRDHFWNVSANLDGRHRFIQSPAFTVGGLPATPVIGTGMDALIWLKVVNGVPEWFHRNSVETFQITPTVKVGSIVVGSSYVNLTTVPANVFGEIFMWRDTNGALVGQNGFFKSNGATADCWANYIGPEGLGPSLSLKFGNGNDAAGLNIRARTADASNGNSWHYYITYRAI